MKVSEITIGETYNHIQIISDLGYHKPDHRYGCKCILCGKEFEISAKHVGKVKTCRECCEKAKITDLSGQRFGRLIVIERAGRNLTPNGTSQTMWRCKCDCGNETTVKYIALTLGNTRSCGCGEIENRRAIGIRPKSERVKKTNAEYEYGFNISQHPTNRIWRGMKSRCYNPNNYAYENYGGRDIKVCERWRNSFENFLADMGERPSPKHSIDRIDVNGDYEPSNCRWATDVEQANNKTDNVFIIVGDSQITAKQFCITLGLNYWTVIHQIRKGLDVNIIARNKGVDMRTKAFRRNPIYYNHNRVASEEVAKLLEEKQAI